jgi:signal transduction histidine kinase
VFELLDNLLHWARLQMERVAFQPLRLDLEEVAQKTVHVLGEVAEAKGIQLVNNVGADVVVYTDGNMLDTVIRNLTNNALKFTAKGGQVIIRARFQEPQTADTNTSTSYGLPSTHYVEVSIADSGVGMSEAMQQKLFKLDQHVTTMGTNRERGTGLGLIICQEMVMKGGGQIWVESEEGRGTTVRFTVQAG